MKYRKKPTYVEAINIPQALYWAGNNWYALPKWLQDGYEEGRVLFLANCIGVTNDSSERMLYGNEWLVYDNGKFYHYTSSDMMNNLEAIHEGN